MEQHNIAAARDARLDSLTGNCGVSLPALVRPAGNPAKGPVRRAVSPATWTPTRADSGPGQRLGSQSGDADRQAGQQASEMRLRRCRGDPVRVS